MKTHVISLGGSIIVPDDVDVQFLSSFRDMIKARVAKGERIIIVCGGGALSASYLKTAKGMGTVDDDAADWIGIYATRINATLVRTLFPNDAYHAIIEDPTAEFETDKRIIIASGWKPGFSTDYDAVILAERFGADRVVNMSNIRQVFDKDPSKHDDAEPLEQISWDNYRAIIQEDWSPRLSTPFDPIASKLAQEKSIKVVVVLGNELANVANVLDGKAFNGTVIG
ncbi:MAG: UMP kinase [archaeon]